MIHLKITSKTHTETYSFNALQVSIGSGASDIKLPNESLQPIHVQIIEENGSFTILNVANDPFVTLNLLPFGKKAITNSDTIQIGETSIEFTGKLSPTKEEQKQADHSDEESVDLEALLREVEEFDTFPEEQIEQQAFEPFSNQASEEPVLHKSSHTLESETPDSQEETFYHPQGTIIEVDDEVDTSSDKEAQEAIAHQVAEKKRRFFTSLAFIFLLAALVGCVVAYLKISHESTKEQMIATEGVSDVAMALAYAQVNHIIPQKQNWFDPDFLKNNLASVLSTEYPSFANIDNQGQFQNCPYMLRIYTSADLKQFLVIAQPEATLFHWLFPKPAIAVDSKTMEMRMISNIRALNRLLANPNVLDSPNAAEISYLVRQGDPITLYSFGLGKGFSPPKALALVRPGAENFIYNAPRYHHFGESLLKKAVSLLQIVGNSHEVTRLQQQMNELSKFPNFVLYSSQGMQKAIQAQKALATLVPNNPFLTAYLSLDANERITNSHLLLNEDYPDFFAQSALQQELHPTILSTMGAMNKPPNTEVASLGSNESPLPLNDIDKEVDPSKPLFLQLSALTMERQRALKAVSDRIIVLLNSHNEGKAPVFSDTFSKLLTWYVQVDQQQQEKVMHELTELYREHSQMPLSQFSAYVRSAGLGIVAKESLHSFSQELNSIKLSAEQVKQQMKKIQDSTSFVELDHTVIETAALLNLNRLPDPEQLIKYQNEMRTETLQQLGKFILSPSSRLPPSAFLEENRALITHILKTAWVTDPDEYDFYLNEFDLLAEDAEKP